MRKLKLLLMVYLIGFSMHTWAQNKQVTGVVLDEQGLPLPGANVVIKGTKNGVVTDFDGNFTLNADNAKGTLVISFIGFANKEVALNGSKKYKIVLTSDATGLEEVAVIGYGSVKRSDLTGAVASMSAKNLTEQSKTDIGQALQGRISGVDVRAISNKPGAPMSIDIRGNTVIKNTDKGQNGVSDNLAADLSQPLFVVDGVFFDDINSLNPADIQQMDILKDASATAIYGARGANGVVIISTKSGGEGKTQFSYQATSGIRSVTNAPDMFSGPEYVKFVGDVLRARGWRTLFNPTQGIAPTVADYNNFPIDMSLEIRTTNQEANNVANGIYKDWVNDYQHTGFQTSHNLGMSGGGNGTTYNASIGYLSDEGVVGIEDFERYNFNLAVTKKVSDKFTVGLKSYLAFSERETGSNELFRSTLRLAPTLSERDANGDIILFPDDQDQRFLNPYYESQGSWRNNTRTFNVIANVFLEYKPTKWVNFKTQFAPSIKNQRQGQYFGLLTKSAVNSPAGTRAYYDTYFNTAYTWDNIVDFNFDVAQGHNLKTTLISSVYYNQMEGSKIENRGFDTDAYLFYNTQAGLDKRTNSTFFTKETLSSFAARVNYSLFDKYLLTFTGRYDASSKLAVNHKWAFFPSAALAWKVTDEDFMKNVSFINNLKLRVSYGESGNDKVITPYKSFAFLEQSNYLYGNTVTNGQVIGGLSNQELTWERSKEYNFGIDLAVLKNRVRLNLELYNKTTVGSILDRTLSAITGYGTAVGNFGSVRNKGIELTLNTTNVQTENFKWTTSLNYSRNKNEILKIDGDRDLELFGTHGVLKVGSPVDAIYFFETEGIWQLDEATKAMSYGYFPGQWKYRDLNDDGKLNQEDYRVLGQVSPKWLGGMLNTFTYKNVDFSVQAYTRQGSFGHSEFYNSYAPWQNDQAKFNKVKLDYWTPNNPGAKYPSVSYASTGERYYTSFDFVRIGNIGLGYNFSKKMLDRLNMTNLRLSVDVQNPFTFTDYKGPDPETGLQDSYNMSYMTRIVLFGLKLTY
ncbi:TonB-dependent receptor [Flavobacterium sp. UMI-01]|uniref:SusC/RagA family TonB-linked outer membrane protein n=1 Tax=Flavobacterium sp. UMI-01 TaxID=1441053 RepID=UPI001C7CFB48|nr:TonB-dependent receptor [Flavobacterium sp. UMI-01]GIZ09748.1 SusC/RagA family TonB-linked outer membrane protein [Flavobacterium sp. UMI-01]